MNEVDRGTPHILNAAPMLNPIKITSLLLLLTLQLVTAQEIHKTPLTIGETIELKSEILNENRTINVYLPNSYNPDSTQQYPVIYLLDGSIDEDFIHVAGTVQFCSFSWIDIIPESIVVGIANIDRKKDFTYPSTVERDQKEFPTAGHSANFMNFIANELQPHINKMYKAKKETTLIGQSLGGLLATQILFERPELFDNFIIVSPSLWWDDENLLKRKLDKSLAGKRIYVGVGDEGPYMIRAAQTLYNKLSIDKSREARLYYNYFEKQNHGDALHLAVYDAFEKLFKKEKKTN